MKLKRHFVWPIMIVLTVYAASGQPRLAAPELGFSYDKIVHLLVFGLLATSILRIPYFFNKGWRGVCTVVLIISLWGVFDEYRQSLTPGRSVELNDWIADTLGAILASILYFKWHWYRRILEYECFGRKRSLKAVKAQ